MEEDTPLKRTRRTFLRASLALPAALLLAARDRMTGNTTEANAAAEDAELVAVAVTPTRRPTARPTVRPTATAVLAPTPDCDDDDDHTPAQTEGPYFTPNSPLRTSLIERGVTGTRLVITGYVLGTNCQPIARALVDVWQADANGVYDNVGYRLRGHQFTDQQGRYTLETVVPGLYPGRTRHIHVKVQAPNQRILTTQLYFPGEARNRTDRIYNAALVLQMTDSTNTRATFNFVLPVV